MKFRLGACAAVILLAACSGEKSADGVAQLPGKSASDAAVATAAVQTGRAVLTSIANAPDRGALMSYQNKGKPSKVEGAFTYYPVAISEDHALRGVVNGQMTVPMPDGSQVKLNYERHDETIDGNWTWVGRVAGGDPNQEAIITFGEKAVFASIPQGQGLPPVSIQTRNGQLYAVQADPSKLKSGNSREHKDTAVPSPSSLVEAAAAKVTAAAAVAQSAPAVAANAPATSLNTVDLAVGYTAGFRTTYGSASAAVTRLAQLVAIGNEGLRNSKVNGYIRLVHALEVSYTETNTNQTALQELTGSNGDTAVTIPASLAPLRTARDTYGADLAILVRQFQQPEQQGCGIAWLIGANGATVNPANDARWGYGVVSDGNDSSYYCAPESFIHEIGHLLGSAHNQANADTPGRYAYSYGYKTDAANGNFFTIMAYGDENQTPYRFFSSPLVNCGSVACGTATADNARSLNQTFPVVAQFRATVVPLAGGRGDVSGDGLSDLIFRNATAGTVTTWEMNGTSVLRTRLQAAGSAYWLAAIGDFNGDGRADLAWTNSAQRIVLFLSTGTGFTSTNVSTVYGSAWTLVGAGDFNADGRDDLLFRNAAAGKIEAWIMNGATIAGRINTNAGSEFTIGAIGDFNGDGRDDIAWTNAARRVVLFLSTGASFTSFTPTFDYGAALGTLVGAGDIDGNGVEELIFRNAAAQTVSWRQMSSTTLGALRTQSAGSAYTLSSIGDFNGDGMDDLVWASTERRLAMFTSTGTAFTATTLTNDFGAGQKLERGGQ